MEGQLYTKSASNGRTMIKSTATHFVQTEKASQASPSPSGINNDGRVTVAGENETGQKRKVVGIDTAAVPPEAKHFCPAVSPQPSAVGRLLPAKVSPEIVPLKSRREHDGYPPELREGKINIAQKDPLTSSDKCQSHLMQVSRNESHHNNLRSHPSSPSESEDGLLGLLQKRDNELMQQFERMKSLNGQNNNSASQSLQNRLKAKNGAIEALFGEIEWIRKLRNGAFLVHDQMLVRLADAEEAVDILRKESELTKRDYKRVLARVRAKHTDQVAKIREEQEETVQNMRREQGATLALLQLEMDKRLKEIERLQQKCKQTSENRLGEQKLLEKGCTDAKAADSSLNESFETSTEKELDKTPLVDRVLAQSKELAEQLQKKLGDANKTIEELQEKSCCAENVHRNDLKELKEKHSHQLAELSSSKEVLIQQIRHDCSTLVSEKEKTIERLKREHDSAVRELGAKLDAKGTDLQKAEMNATDQNARMQLLEGQLRDLQVQCNSVKDQYRKEMEHLHKEKAQLQGELNQKKLSIEQLEKQHLQEIDSLSSTHKSRLENVMMDKEDAISTLRAEVEGHCAQIKKLKKEREEQNERIRELEKTKEEHESSNHSDHNQSGGQVQEKEVNSDGCDEVASDAVNCTSDAVNCERKMIRHEVPASMNPLSSSCSEEGARLAIAGIVNAINDSKAIDGNVDTTKLSPISEEESVLVGQHKIGIGATMEGINKEGPLELEESCAASQQSQSPAPGRRAGPVQTDKFVAKEGRVEDDCKLREKIDSLLQSAVPHEVISRFRQVAFAEWTGQWLPAIELGPYDVTPGPMRKQWLTMAEKHVATGSPMKRLVYWYGVRNMMEAYSFLPPSRVISYEEGVRRGYDEIPAKIQAKLESAGEEGKKKRRLSPSEKHRVNALLEMRWEAKLEPRKRLSWANWD